MSKQDYCSLSIYIDNPQVSQELVDNVGETILHQLHVSQDQLSSLLNQSVRTSQGTLMNAIGNLNAFLSKQLKHTQTTLSKELFAEARKGEILSSHHVMWLSNEVRLSMGLDTIDYGIPYQHPLPKGSVILEGPSDVQVVENLTEVYTA